MKEKSIIYLVDDQKIVNFVNRKVLEKAGIDCVVRSFQKPQKALKACRKEFPELILLDLQMPKINGWQFMASLKGLNLSTKVIILTSSSSSIDRERAMEYNRVLAYMVKPLTVDKVLHFKKEHCLQEKISS